MLRFKSPVVLVAVGILILTILSLALLAVVKMQNSPSTVTQAVPEGTLLRNTIKSAFASNDSKGILAYFDLAFEQKQPQQAYDYLKKTFAKMITSYNSVKNPEKKAAMNKLKIYSSSLPEYKESDFVLPK